MQLLRALATKSGLGGRFIALVVALLGGCGGGGGGGTASIDPFQLFTSVAVADLDGDGLPDIAATYAWVAGPPPHSGYVAVYLQDRARPGNFLPAAVYAVGNDPVSIAIGDLDADGKADMVTADTITHADGVGSSTVSVLRQDPTRSGRYLPAVAYATGFSPTSVALGDLNADGKPDLAVADRGGISLLFQNPATPGTFQSRSVLAVGATYSVSIGDVDGDGKPDLVGTQASQDQVLVLLQDRQVAGTFLSPARYVAGAQPVHAALADLDGDRRPDIALANLGAPADPGSASASVLLQDPATPGDFRGAVDYATANRSSAVAIADLNGDTRADLAVANAGSLSGLCPPDCDSAGAGVSVLLQDPAVAGRYLPATNYSTSDGEYGAWVAVADLNGDGRADLVIAQSNGIFIRLQDPLRAGQFQAAVPVSN